MDAILIVDVTTFNRVEMTAHVVNYAKRHYHGEANEDQLALWAAGAVAHLWDDAFC